jgi:glycosyltransferase involved in cell wall biosynthesis
MSQPTPTAHPSVSLLLPNRDNERVLGSVLEHLAANTTYDNVEVVAVDDGSTDSSLEILRQWRDRGHFSGFELLERDHGGAIEALNAGLEAASGEVVVQLDADASIETSGWLERLLDILLFDDRVGVVTAKVVLDAGGLHASACRAPRGGHHGRRGPPG